MGPAFDRAAYKAAQRRGWSEAADGWRRWWHKLEADALSERLLDLAQVKEGDRVLDVATGIGEPAVTAARRVGREGHVVATDISPAMLEIGRERAAELGLANIEFREADAEELDLPEAEFDVVLSRFGLMFVPDVDEALRRIHHSLRDGGRFAAAVWHGRSPLFAIARAVAARELGLASSEPAAPATFGPADRRRLDTLLSVHGFVDVRSEVVEVSTPYDSVDEYIEYLQDTGVGIKNLLAEQSAEGREEVWEAIRRATGAVPEAAGSFVERVDALTVVGRRG